MLVFQNFMDYQRSTRLGYHYDPLYPAGVSFLQHSKELARILKPLAGQTTYSVQNTKDFVDQIKNIKLLPDECIISYNVKALFTSVPIEPAIKIIKQHLENDKELQQRTSISVQHIIMLLEFCLKNTHFVFQGRFYEQTEGAAMGSPLSPIIANLYMEALEEKATNTSPMPPSPWRRFVDDTFVIIKKHRRIPSSAISTP